MKNILLRINIVIDIINKKRIRRLKEVDLFDGPWLTSASQIDKVIIKQLLSGREAYENAPYLLR